MVYAWVFEFSAKAGVSCQIWDSKPAVKPIGSAVCLFVDGRELMMFGVFGSSHGSYLVSDACWIWSHTQQQASSSVQSNSDSSYQYMEWVDAGWELDRSGYLMSKLMSFATEELFQYGTNQVIAYFGCPQISLRAHWNSRVYLHRHLLLELSMWYLVPDLW